MVTSSFCLRLGYGWALPLLLCLGPPQSKGGVLRLDPSRGFYYPPFAAGGQAVLAETTAGPLAADTYLRYLAGRLGTRYLADFAFDVLLARECQARRLARNAPLLARSLAAKRLFESGRQTTADVDGSLRCKFANQALRRLRADALIGEQRAADAAELQDLFDRRYGVGGLRVRVRQLLVSLERTRQRLSRRGAPTDTAAVLVAARVRAAGLWQRAKKVGLAPLLPETDDRMARRLLRDPERIAQAGFLQGYNYGRYGEDFAVVVRGLKVGALSAPVQTVQGFHIIELVSRRVTILANVEEKLRAELRRGPATSTEIMALRQELLKKHGFRAKSTVR